MSSTTFTFLQMLQYPGTICHYTTSMVDQALCGPTKLGFGPNDTKSQQIDFLLKYFGLSFLSGFPHLLEHIWISSTLK